MRYFIISLPKSGTYLAANLYQELGIDFSYIHYNVGGYTKYDPNNFEDSKKNPVKYTNKGPLIETIDLLGENQVAVGHIKHEPRFVELFKPLNKVLMTRRRLDIDASAKRWKEYSGRNVSSVLSTIPAILEWRDEPDVFVLNFNDINNCNVERIDELQKHLFGEVKVDSELAVERALSKDSMTKVP